MVSKEPRWVPEEISVPRDALQQQDTSTVRLITLKTRTNLPEHNIWLSLKTTFQALVNPLPKERWNSTAASCSSNTIGPLCSDVIEKNWDFLHRLVLLDMIRKKSIWVTFTRAFLLYILENTWLNIDVVHYWGPWAFCKNKLIDYFYKNLVCGQFVSICTFQNLLYCVQESEPNWHI